MGLRVVFEDGSESRFEEATTWKSFEDRSGYYAILYKAEERFAEVRRYKAISPL